MAIGSLGRGTGDTMNDPSHSELPHTPGEAFSLSAAKRIIGNDEHASRVLRLRRVTTIGMVAWILFGLTDWFIVAFVEPGRLWVYWGLRAIGLVVVALSVVRLHRQPLPSERFVGALEIGALAILSALVSVSCLEFRGIESPLALGIITILVARGAALSDHYKRGLLGVGLIVLAHPVVLLGMALFSPEIAAQLGDSRAVGAFVLNQFFIIGAGLITVASGHAVWALRKRVYETRSFGRYRLKRLIGRGGMGEVWAAHHHTLRRDVAVKILSPSKINDLAMARFEREVRTMSELTHPNTVRVFDYGVTEDGLCYYAMELLEGDNLSTMVRRDGPMPPLRAVRLVWQAARALAEAHERGIVHRDIKAGNIFVTSAGSEVDLVKVLDFGLARLTSQEPTDATLTETGWVVGTPAYMSPEVVLGQSADARADIYGLGVVLYFLLCGRPPFEAEDRRELLVAHLNTPPTRPSEVTGKPIHSAVEAVVLRCLAKKPADRYQNATDLAHALARCTLPPSPRAPSAAGDPGIDALGDLLTDPSSDVATIVDLFPPAGDSSWVDRPWPSSGNPYDPEEG